jgi:hypothetical protein
VVLAFLSAMALTAVVFFLSRDFGAAYFYSICFVLGIFAGYWAVFMTISAEQFGTNLRATVTTSTPNFVRGSVALLTSSFHWLTPALGLVGSAVAVGVTTLAVGLFALSQLEETHGKDLDFVES